MSDTVNPATDSSKTAEERLAALAKQQEKANASQAAGPVERERNLAERQKHLAAILKKRQSG